MEVGVGRKFTVTGEVPWKEFVELAFLRAPLKDSCCQKVSRGFTRLLRYFTNQGMV
jgi:hypothetical protein